MVSLKLEQITRARSSLHFAYSTADLRFSTAYWYQEIDFYHLERKFGPSFMERLYFHIAVFEINKFVSLKPDAIAFGRYSRYWTEALAELWRDILANAWAQWRYENDLPEYHGPTLPTVDSSPRLEAMTHEVAETEILSFCGGGKDSLVAMKLLERSGLSFDSLGYSSSIYGTSTSQHRLLDGLLDHSTAGHRRRQWIYEDYMDSPVLDLRPEFQVKTLAAAETPSSIFAALPFVLGHQYRYIALGHERSADTGQLVWDKTGEEVNHQWGKSLEAERLINRYIRTNLIEDFSYFSILKAVYDVVIFSMLRRDIGVVPATHSCNERKPWCKRCPKCAYVWLGYMAFLPIETVQACFGSDNLFEMDENQLTYRQLLGLEEQLPFECIGQQGEARLFFEICRRKGYGGKAIEMFIREAGAIDIESLLAKYLSVNWQESAIPPTIQGLIRPQLENAVEEARAYVTELKVS